MIKATVNIGGMKKEITCQHLSQITPGNNSSKWIIPFEESTKRIAKNKMLKGKIVVIFLR